MNARIALFAALPALALSACSYERPAERPPVSPAAEVIGEPRNCISLTQIRATRVRDDYTIDFEGPGNKVWRNTLTNRCPGLTSQDAFTYKTSLSQLCSNEIIYVLDRVGGELQRGAGCGLGPFVPVKLAKD